MNKKNILFMLLFLLSIGMKAQINIIDLNAVFQTDSIDQARLVVQYEMKYVKDTTNEKQLLDPLKETLMLEIGQKASKCYSYTFYHHTACPSLWQRKHQLSDFQELSDRKSDDHRPLGHDQHPLRGNQ